MFTDFVNWRVVGLLFAGRNRNRRFDLFAANPAEIVAQVLTVFQLVAHVAIYSRASLTLLYRFSPVISRPNQRGGLNWRQRAWFGNSTSATLKP